MAKRSHTVTSKRAYEPASQSDGTRVLVDRLWPRGITKEHAHIDLLLKDLAPSSKLRTWFAHAPERFPEFRRRYAAELESGEGRAALDQLRELLRQGSVTLVFAARDAEHSNAAVLCDLLQCTKH